MFTSNFQSSVPIAITMMPVVATLTDNPQFLEDLRKEIDGKVCCTYGCKSVFGGWRVYSTSVMSIGRRCPKKMALVSVSYSQWLRWSWSARRTLRL